jgi:nucleoside-diphosphate-sugar epimerase
MHVLVTGATGKVGRALLPRLAALDPAPGIRALYHNRGLEETGTLEVFRGSIADPDTAVGALRDVTHVVHLATCKETPDAVMDVTVKGLFLLLEAFRDSPSARRFLLVGGDAAVGHFFHRHDAPITEDTPHRAYPGCYALSKVLEEVMLAQYGVQYGLDWCCLRAPWIMEKDDFRFSLSFGEDRFGGPDWAAMVTPEVAAGARASGAVPLPLDADGRALRRNFIHVDDLVSAIVLALDAPVAARRLYNVAMDEPVDYGVVAAHLRRTRGIPSIPIRGPYHSTWLDNARARSELGWRPSYDTERLVEAAWTHVRAADDPRKVWYPG